MHLVVCVTPWLYRKTVNWSCRCPEKVLLLCYFRRCVVFYTNGTWWIFVNIRKYTCEFFSLNDAIKFEYLQCKYQISFNPLNSTPHHTHTVVSSVVFISTDIIRIPRSATRRSANDDRFYHLQSNTSFLPIQWRSYETWNDGRLRCWRFVFSYFPHYCIYESIGVKG